MADALTSMSADALDVQVKAKSTTEIDKEKQTKAAVRVQRLAEASAAVPPVLPPLPAHLQTDELRGVVAAVTSAWDPARLQAELDSLLTLTPEAFASRLRSLETLAASLHQQETALRGSTGAAAAAAAAAPSHAHAAAPAAAASAAASTR